MTDSHVSSPPATLVDLLEARAGELPGKLLYRFLETGEANGRKVEWTYADLSARARAIAVELTRAGLRGQRALLLYPPGIDFIAGFFGCIYAGCVAVPAYPPVRSRSATSRASARLVGIAKDAGAVAVLTTTDVAQLAEASGTAPELGQVKWICTDAVPLDLGAEWQRPDIGPTSLAFLQYTSGSTGRPKGVMVSHGNILANQRMIEVAMGGHRDSHIVGWLPVFHDMGLIGNVFHPIHLGASATLMSPLAFLQRPMRWLQAISHYRADIAGGPNFSYDFCIRKATPAEVEALDLSCWELAFNGAEPIRSETMDRFSTLFAPSGFKRESFYPTYGLAEATLIVSGGVRRAPLRIQDFRGSALAEGKVDKVERAAAPADAVSLVGCGRSLPGQDLRIVDPESRAEREAGRIGEIWVSGAHVAGGYWNLQETTEETFHARLTTGEGPFMRTGDLGFLLDGELHINGRLKDLIIIRGRNHYPQDIEETVERCHPAMRAGCVAAFSVQIEDEERVVVVAEAEEKRFEGTPAELASSVHGAIVEGHSLKPHAIVLVAKGTIPKTSSGKIQRRACKGAFLAGSLEESARAAS